MSAGPGNAAFKRRNRVREIHKITLDAGRSTIMVEHIKMIDARARFLHVANGTSTTATIEKAGVPGLRSIWADPLYEGPVPAGLTDDELLEVRRRHLSNRGDGRAGPLTRSDRSAEAVNDLREWRAALLRHGSYAEVVLWFEHDLFDQLNLIQLLAWMRERLPAATPVSLICIGSFPGRPNFKGLGELTSDELAPLLETRQPVTDRQYALAKRAWLAFRAQTPEAVDALRHDDTSALPYLTPAITRFLQEYPWTDTGLSRTERRLFELADGGIALVQAFPRLVHQIGGPTGAFVVIVAGIVAGIVAAHGLSGL